MERRLYAGYRVRLVVEVISTFLLGTPDGILQDAENTCQRYFAYGLPHFTFCNAFFRYYTRDGANTWRDANYNISAVLQLANRAFSACNTTAPQTHCFFMSTATGSKVGSPPDVDIGQIPLDFVPNQYENLQEDDVESIESCSSTSRCIGDFSCSIGSVAVIVGEVVSNILKQIRMAIINGGQSSTWNFGTGVAEIIKNILSLVISRTAILIMNFARIGDCILVRLPLLSFSLP
jgi:hypothetical protein